MTEKDRIETREDNRTPEQEAPEKDDRQEPEGEIENGVVEEETEAVAEPTPEELLAELNDRYLRLAAEFDNYKKRTAREWIDRVKGANAELLYELLDITDNFERALAVEHPDSAYAQGVKLIFQQLQSLLERNGVERIPAIGKPFDPAEHDALLHMHSDEYDEGVVCQEIRPGYRLHERILRHAQVAVSKGASNDEQNEE